MAPDVKVEVEGLKELRAALRQLGDGAPRELAKVNKEAAGVAVPAIERLVARRTGKTAASVRAFGAQTSAGIRAGGAAAPHFGWLNFGGKRPRDRVARPRVKPDRYVYRGIEEKEGQIVDTYVDALDRLMRTLGLRG